MSSSTGPASNVTCESGFDWADDAAGHSPCYVTAAVVGGCGSATENVPPLTSGNHYGIPGTGTTSLNQCSCSWAAYNLFSACTACQGLNSSIQTWASYSANCGSLLSSTTYYPSNATTLSNTSMPYWATTNPLTWADHIFNISQAISISQEDHPDVYGAPLTSASSTSSSTSSTPSISSTTSSASKSKSDAAAIGGGVAGGVVVLLIGVILAWWILRRRDKRNGGPQELDSTENVAPTHSRSFSDLTKTSHPAVGYGYGSGNVGTINMQQLRVPGVSPSPFGSSTNMGSVSSMGVFSTPPHQVVQVGGGGNGAPSLYGNASSIPSRYGSPSPSVQFMNRSYSPDSNGHSVVGGAEVITQPFALLPTSTSPPPPPAAAPVPTTRTSVHENSPTVRGSQDSLLEHINSTPQRRMNPPTYDDAVALSNSRDVATQRREAHGTAHAGGSTTPARPSLGEKREVSQTSFGSQPEDDSSIWTTSVGNGNLSVTSHANAPTPDLAAIDAFVSQITSSGMRPGAGAGENGDTVPMLHTTALAPGQPRPGIASRRYTVNTTIDDGNESVLGHAEGEGERIA